MKKKYIFLIVIFIIACLFVCKDTGVICVKGANRVSAFMPFYGVKPSKLVQRSVFATDYSTSSPERKHNVELAVKSLNDTFVDINGEFSFNMVVGERTEKRGYQNAKIISNNKFIDGIGGGVCQVSSTLYNAILLADLKVIEVHAHSVAVSYIEPSFDAMVNYYCADLKFINTTNSPVIIKAKANGEKIVITIIGEQMDYRIKRQNKVVERIEPTEEFIEDETGEYGLTAGEEQIVFSGKEGIISEGYLVRVGKNRIDKTLIRKDSYKAVNKVIVRGK
ncbi:MAG: VanW family protein [Clostridia bacterium]|nr:VanW family protein [Clostridia bacterium]